MTINHFDTLVIGGGQAGLAAGYHLSRRAADFLIVDANPTKDLRSRTRVWLVYPVLRVLALAALGVVYGAILIEDESDAAVASQAILDTVESVRIGTSLADS